MSPDRDRRGSEVDDDFPDDEAPRSIFSATWFRVFLVVLVLVIAGAVAVPYVLDVVNPPSKPPAVATPATIEGAGGRAPATPAPAAKPGASATPTPAAKTAATPAPASKVESIKVESPKTKEPAPGAAAKKEPARSEGAGSRARATPAPAAKPATSPAVAKASEPRATAAAGGEYFVQVGAFREPETAKRVAARLREQRYPVEESVKTSGDTPAPRAPAAAAGDRYDVLVSGGTAADINTKLAAKGLASEPAGASVRIRPSLPLRDAVALSKDLGTEGFKVQVRRATGGAAAAPATPAASNATGGGHTLYRVRVGGYPDRAAALGVLRELEGKGYQPFLAKGRD